MFRYFFALCFVAVFTIAVNAQFQESQGGFKEADEFRSPAGKAVAKILASLAGTFAGNCILEAGEHCKDLWKKPGEALNCGKEFLRNNKGRCALGK